VSYRADPIPELKQEAARELARIIHSWNAHDIAVSLGTDQPRISDLRRGKLDRFSLETLIRFLSRRRYRVQLTIEPELRPRLPRTATR